MAGRWQQKGRNCSQRRGLLCPKDRRAEQSTKLCDIHAGDLDRQPEISSTIVTQGDVTWQLSGGLGLSQPVGVTICYGQWKLALALTYWPTQI